MSLPSDGITWKEYEIDTPTFKLTPIEKPDFSPYLVHMTGRNSLLSILQGEIDAQGRPIHQGTGLIRSSVPVFDSQVNYDSSVVCFTETPLFAIDFFRYRSFRRWRADLRYGIGFEKNQLVHASGVRPVLYTDSILTTQILRIARRLANDELVVEGAGNQLLIRDIFTKLKPLIFPLLEGETKQGYMWEREWRYPFDNNLRFAYSSIKIICCPVEEKDAIQEILGEHLDGITIVQTWKEYDEVTSYMKRRQNDIGKNIEEDLNKIGSIDELQDLKNKNDQTFNALRAYHSVFKDTLTALDANGIEALMQKINATSEKISARIKLLKVEQEQKVQNRA